MITYRWDFLNYLITRYGFQSYLEIGCYHDWCFNAVDCEIKVGVDPSCGGTHRMTSNEFFSTNTDTFDLVFIDGLHTHEQSLQDVKNAVDHISKNGVIVMHDCLPVYEYEQTPTMTQSSWMGEVWKTLAMVRCWDNVDSAVYDVDCGLGIVIPRKNTQRLENLPPLNWESYQQHRQSLLRVCSLEEIQKFLP